MPRGGPWLGPSRLTLLIVLIAAAVGALSLARQRPIVPPPKPPPPAWAVAGHDSARTAHSLSYPAALPLTLRWWREFQPPATIARPPVVDGYGNIYLARPDSALQALKPSGDTRWCVAEQPITDTTCAGPSLQGPIGQALPRRPVPPNALVGPDDTVYVVDGAGGLAVFDPDPKSATPVWHGSLGLVAGAGVALSPDGTTLYGVAEGPARSLYGVVALRQRRNPSGSWGRAPGWRTTFIHALKLSPVSVAPDGTPLVVAAAPAPDGRAMLYALDPTGGVRWRVPLAAGRPSYAAIEPTGTGWIAWIAVAGPVRSWVYLVDNTGHMLWDWPTLHHLDTRDGGIALSLQSKGCPSARTGIGYVSSEVGIYALDRRIHHPWLFFDTRPLGAGTPGAPTTDVCGGVYVATSHGDVYSLVPTGHTISPLGRVRWSYDTGRDARGSVELDADGNVLVMSRTADGGTVLESLGSAQQAPNPQPVTPLPSTTTVVCAGSDCPTPMPTPTTTPTITPTVTATPAATATPTATPTATATGTATATATGTATATATPPPTVTVPVPAIGIATPVGEPSPGVTSSSSAVVPTITPATATITPITTTTALPAAPG